MQEQDNHSKVPDQASDIGTLVAFEGEADPAL